MLEQNSPLSADVLDAVRNRQSPLSPGDLNSATGWWTQEGPRELRRATSGPAAHASRAIMILSRQPFYRHQIAESLVQALDRREPELVVMTCAALGRLGSQVAVEGLVEAPDHDREDVRGAVRAALVQITGEDRGPTLRDWRQRRPRAR